MSKNSNLHKAKGVKNDEFYTRLEDIEKELSNYRQHFENKIVYCNCDSVPESQFWVYFHTHFAELRLKKLVATHFNRHNFTDKYEYCGGNDADVAVHTSVPLNSHGDFRSPQCIAVMKEADIVVSNPPFSLCREYVNRIVKNNKKFLFIGPKNIIGYKEVFPLLRNNEMWVGVNNVPCFIQADGSVAKFGNVGWFTNLEHNKRHEPIKLTKHFNQDEYPIFDNYPAFNVDKVADIPIEDDFEMIVTEEQLKDMQRKGFDIEILEVIKDE
jgi:hypothetical protein